MLLHNHISTSGGRYACDQKDHRDRKDNEHPGDRSLIVAGDSGRFYSFRENHPEMFNVTVPEAVTNI